MDKDRIKGKVKDIAGRVQRQSGEWTGSTEDELRGTEKQVEGKAQEAYGRIKDAARSAARKVDEKLNKSEPRRERPSAADRKRQRRKTA